MIDLKEFVGKTVSNVVHITDSVELPPKVVITFSDHSVLSIMADADDGWACPFLTIEGTNDA